MYDERKFGELLTEFMQSMKNISSIEDIDKDITCAYYHYPFKPMFSYVLESFEINFNGMYNETMESKDYKLLSSNELMREASSELYKAAKCLSEIEADVPMRRKFNSVAPNNFYSDRGYTVSKYYKELVKWANRVDEQSLSALVS